MIKFFRKIRQRFFTDKEDKRTSFQTNNYLFYAMGEIFLVVVGILIALEVNNWNENRKFRIEGEQMKQDLYDEFLDNRVVLNERIQDLEKANHFVKAVLSYMNSDIDTLEKINVDSLISYSLKYGNYNPSNSIISELISSGKLNLITNKSLKKNLYKWLQLLKDSDEDFKNQDLQATTDLRPYLSKTVSTNNLNMYNNMDIYEESQLFSGDYYGIFHDMEFENLYHQKLFWNMIMINHYKELDELAIEILNQSKENI